MYEVFRNKCLLNDGRRRLKSLQGSGSERIWKHPPTEPHIQHPNTGSCKRAGGILYTSCLSQGTWMGKAVWCDSTSEMKTNPPYRWMKFLKFLTNCKDFFWAIFPVNKNLTALAEAGNSCPVRCLLRPWKHCKSWRREDVLYLQHAKASSCHTAGGLVQRFGAWVTWITADPVAAPWLGCSQWHFPSWRGLSGLKCTLHIS